MKSKTKILSIALVISAYCCSPGGGGDGSVSEVIVNGNTVYVSSLNDLKSDTTTIPLSSLVEYCILVQFETKENAFVNPQQVTVTDKYIGIKERGRKPYKLFERSGKFLTDVGSIGNGPGEYGMPISIGSGVVIDDENELIYLAPWYGNKILVYNTSGQFLKDIAVPNQLKAASIFLSDNILTVVQVPVKDESIAIQLDVTTGEILKRLAPPANLTVKSFNDDQMIASARNVPEIFDFSFFNVLSDTLYHYDLKNNRILPVYTMKYRPSEDIWRQYYMLNKDLIFTRLHCFKRFLNCNKSGFVATDLKHKKSSHIRVVNDFYGNMRVPIIFNNFHNGYWVHSIQPEDLIEDIEKRLIESSCTEDDRKTLKNLLSTLAEGANNLLFVGKLKSEIEMELF